MAGSTIYYPPEVSSLKYYCLGVFRKEYFRLQLMVQIERKNTEILL